MRALWLKFRKPVERMTDRLTEAQLDSVRVILALLAIAVIGSAGYFAGWPAWQRWQNRRSLSQAETFAGKGDFRSLILVLRRATQLAPNDIETWRKTARLLGEIRSPDELVARERLVQLAPRDMALRLALAQEAVDASRFDIAESALAGVDGATRQGVAFHRLAASLAAAQGRSTDLEKEFKAILALAPADLDARFGYAALRLWGTDQEAREAARAELEKLLMEPSLRVRAAIELLSEASNQDDPQLVAEVLDLLLARFAPGTPADFSTPAAPAWTALLAGVKAAAAASPADAALVARWLAAMDRWAEALSWLESLPPGVRTAAGVTDIAAQLSAEHGDLPRLGRLLRGGAWGDWPASAQTLAIASRIQSLHFGKETARTTWKDATAACGKSSAGFRALSRLASIWGDFDGEDGVLQAALREDPRAFWAYDALRTLYVANDDLPRLWDLYGAWSQQLPDDASIAAARIMLGSVLDRGGSGVAAAGQLRARFPGSLPAQVAYAAALWRGGRAAEAWPVLAALPPEALERPDVSFWVALVQADRGHPMEAAAALRRVMPRITGKEEKSLLQAAAVKVGFSP